jgi:hypothetical protein
MIATLKPGDTVMVTRLDRLARSTRGLLNVLDQVAKAGAAFRSLADARRDRGRRQVPPGDRRRARLVPQDRLATHRSNDPIGPKLAALIATISYIFVK